MQSEKAFFEAALSHANPGWTLKLAPELTPGQMDLARFGVRVYLVDTSSDWVAAGAAEVQAFDLAAAAAKSAKFKPEAVHEALGTAMGKLSRQRFDDLQAEQSAIVKTMQLAIAALTTTQTFGLVKPKGLAGHWVYFAYRCFDASIVTRPMYFNSKESGFVSRESLADITKTIIGHDLANPASAVGIRIKKGGGALLASH